MIRTITIAREYGSGGGEIAKRVAAELDWRFVDRDLIAEVARLARVAPEDAAPYDEHAASWMQRLAKSFWSGGPEGFMGGPRTEVFDADRMAELTRQVILGAAGAGECVIVGRGGQCILRGRAEAFHVFVFAPRAERVHRVRHRYPTETDADAALDDIDLMRAAYIRRYYACDWSDRRLYDLLINSRLGEEKTASAIICASGVRGGQA